MLVPEGELSNIGDEEISPTIMCIVYIGKSNGTKKKVQKKVDVVDFEEEEEEKGDEEEEGHGVPRLDRSTSSREGEEQEGDEVGADLLYLPLMK